MPGLHIDEIGGKGELFFNNPNNYVVTNYQDLKVLLENGELEPGRKYLLTNYLHKYFIDGSNSSGIVKRYRVSSYTYGYAIFGYYAPNLNVGRQVVVDYLPEGYVGVIRVGDITTVSANSQNFYFKFANGMHTITGIGIKVYLTRYTSIEEGAEINDANGRPVMIPGGLINTLVHDGVAYMEMTAAENLPVAPEQLILKANAVGSLDKMAQSFTYEGDEVEFDFYDTEIYNDNKEIIGTRNGFINRRINEALNMDINRDWRNQKYRRWCLDLDSRTKLLNQHLDVNTTKLGFEGKWLYTAGLRRVDQPQYFFVGISFEGEMINLDENAQKTTFQYLAVSPIFAKDFTIIPLDAERNPFNAEIRASFFSNSVFLCLAGEDTYGAYVTGGGISDSTFVSATAIGDPKELFSNTIALDTFSVDSSESYFNKVVALSKTQINQCTRSLVEDTIFGTMQNGARISGNDQPTPVVWWIYVYISESTIMNCAFSGVTPFIHLENTRLVETSIFAYYSPSHPGTPNDSKYQREVFKIQSGVFSKITMRFLNNVDRVILENLLFKDSNTNRANGLSLYDFRDAIYSRVLKINDATQAIYFEEMDGNYNRTFRELSKVRENPIDTGISIAVDNAAPVIGTNVVFTLTAINSGTNAATNVLVDCLLPSGYTFVSDNAAGSYDSVAGIWTVGNLAPGASKVITVTATVNEAGDYTVNAEISAKELETAPADNTVSISTVPTAAV